jgi:hypothetical protein
MARLYASTRTEELAPVPWPEEIKQAFLHAQFELQRGHYRKHYRHAEFLVIERAGQPIGRLYLHPGAHEEIRIMDIIAASVSGCWKTAASIIFSNGDRIS